MPARVTINLSTQGEFEIWLNQEGRDLLVRHLQALNELNDHCHLMPRPLGEVPLASTPYRPSDWVFEYGKILFRTDASDSEHYPHVMSDQRPEDGESQVDDRGRAREIAERALLGNYDILLACQDLSGCDLPNVPAKITSFFRGVDSEIDGFPLGPEQEHWNHDALKRELAEASKYREKIRAIALVRFQALLGALKNPPTGSNRD